jgi:ribosomal protein S1
MKIETEEVKPILNDTSIMGTLMRGPSLAIPKQDDLVEGSIIGQKGSIVFVDIPPLGTGVIYGQELINAHDVVRVLKPGDKITVKITEMENEMGYLSLSLKKANQEIVWREAEDAQRSKTVFDLAILDANKGGLIMEWKGVQGFLPASQLKTENYPRIENGDKDMILEELKKLVGEKISVTILSTDQKEKKLIFSEKSTEAGKISELLEKYKVDDVVEGTITGIVDFGIFIKLEEGLEGLVHISEIDWALVEDPAKLFNVGDTVKTKIISLKDNKVSLSIKALKENPWVATEKKYNIGDIVKGVVIKFNRHGALASIEEGVAGLVHVSEFTSESDIKNKLELGKSYTFQITLFEPKNQKLVLKYLEEEKN